MPRVKNALLERKYKKLLTGNTQNLCEYFSKNKIYSLEFPTTIN